MKILYFAQARLAAGCSEESVTVSQSITADLFWEHLVQLHPSLRLLQPSCRLAKNGSYLQPNQPLDPEDEVAILPPMSGG